MINQNIFKLMVICFFAINATSSGAQQSKVDSAIIYLKKSFASNKLDSVSIEQVFTLLRDVSLNNSQISQIESTLNTFKNWENKQPIHNVKFSILSELIINSDVDKTISYGKQQIEQLEKINTPEASTIKSQYLNALRFPFRNSNRLEDGFQYYTKKLNEYKIKNDSLCIAQCHFVLGGFYRISGLLDLAIYNMKKSISYIDSTKNIRSWYNNVGVLGYYYVLKEDADECIKYNRIVNEYYIKTGSRYAVISNRMAKAMLIKDQLDSAAYFLTLAKTDSTLRAPEQMTAFLQVEAEYKIQSGAFAAADSILQKCQKLIIENKLSVNASAGTIAPDYLFAQLCIKQGRLQEAIDFLHLDIIRLLNNRVEILRDYRLIAELYAKLGNGAMAAEAYAIFLSKQDSLLTDQEKYRSISFEAEQQMNENEASIASLESQNRIASLSRNFLIGITALLLLGALGIYQRFRFKKKANFVLEKTLADLKSTQAQLIQSEKMASLGELTAGIAHEIQNPLNFVNNFSEVSNELISELKVESSKVESERDKGLEDEILNDIAQNLTKINHHGNRASDIVKGMLEHSRTSTGQKEATDINALCNDYLRLAYQGQKAKNKDFNATMETHFDPNLPKVDIIPQDIGRVILNLINNAFYAVNERNKQGEEGYQPLVSITTQLTANSQLLIAVKDNGFGIPDAIKAKIFQPFFTTKPTGQGTGLGLSLSYDIVKANGGELKVETKEGEGSTFIISLRNHTV
jgi:signal transduction histidine kinase